MNLWCAEPILDIEGMGVFLGHIFQNRVFCLLVTHTLKPLLTISDENAFFKTHCTRLGTIVASNKGLE